MTKPMIESYTYDPESDVLEVHFEAKRPAWTIELTDNIMLSVDRQTGRAVALLFLDFTEAETLNRCQQIASRILHKSIRSGAAHVKLVALRRAPCQACACCRALSAPSPLNSQFPIHAGHN